MFGQHATRVLLASQILRSGMLAVDDMSVPADADAVGSDLFIRLETHPKRQTSWTSTRT